MTIAEPTADAEPAETLEFEFDLEAPLDKVWRAVSEPDLLADWLDPEAIGANLGGPIDCQVLEAEPERFVRYGWRGDGEGGPLETEVLFELSQGEAGVHLRIVHTGFKPATMIATAPRVVSLADYRARRSCVTACLGGLQWAA